MIDIALDPVITGELLTTSVVICLIALIAVRAETAKHSENDRLHERQAMRRARRD